MTTTTTVRGVLSTLSTTLFLLAAIAAAAICGPQASAATLGKFMYGVDDANEIWEINPVDQTLTKVVTSAELGSGANALAYNSDRNHLFFIDSSNALGYWNRSTDTVSGVSGLSLGITINPGNAAYHNDAFYFFENNSNVLQRATIAYSGSGESAVPSVTSVDPFPILDIGGGPGVNTNTFGDIAIDTVNNVLYASTSRGRFYSIDLADPFQSFDEIVPSPGNDRSVGMQLAFDENSSTLYGHNYASGNWYVIDTNDGSQTQIVGFNTVPVGGKGFRDLGGSAVAPVPEPSTIGLAAVGLVGGLGYTGLRRRQKAAKAAA